MSTGLMTLLNGSTPPPGDLYPPKNAQAASNEAGVSLQDLPPMPAQQREEALSRGMLIASMVTVLLVLAVLGGIAVYVTQRHKAAPEMKDV